MNRPTAEQIRQREIHRLRGELEAQGFPRLKMMLLVALTGGSGFLASYLMLHQGILAMTVRYPLAVGMAYGVFLMLLWLWLRTKAEDYTDAPSPDLSGNTPGGRGGCADGPIDSGDPGESGLGDFAEAVGGADEFAIPLLLIAALVAMVFAAGWIIYSAPLLFAELLVDGVLAASLYRRLRGIEPRHWLETAIRRTWLPFAITALVCWAAALILHAMAPEAHSIGAVLHR